MVCIGMDVSGKDFVVHAIDQRKGYATLFL